MRKMLRLLPLLWFLLTASLVFSQVTVTTGTSNIDCNGNPLTVNEARFNWTSSVATDSMVWISQDYPCGSCSADPAVDYDRQVYNSTKVTSHCVTVNYLEPSFAAPNNLVGYDYAAGGCTDSSGGTCSRTDPNLTFAGTGYFTTPKPAAGTFSFTPVATGPRNVYKLAGMNLPVNIIWDGGTYTQGTQFMTLTSATIDGQSCLPGALAGAACGTTGICLQMLCTGGSESINPATNNYNVSLYSVSGTYYHDYTCYNHYVGEHAVELRIVPGSTAATLMPHTISATFTLLNNSGGVIATSSPITWGFSVKATPSFTVTNPTSFPTLPNYGKYLATSAKYNTYACGVMDTGIAAGIFMNSNMSANDTAYDPWAVFNYDGNRIFKQLKDIFGSATGTWQPSTAYSVGQ